MEDHPSWERLLLLVETEVGGRQRDSLASFQQLDHYHQRGLGEPWNKVWTPTLNAAQTQGSATRKVATQEIVGQQRLEDLVSVEL